MTDQSTPPLEPAPDAGSSELQTASRFAESRGARWRRRAAAIARDLAILGVIVAAVQLWRARELVARGEPAPELSLVDLEGRRHTLADLEGTTALLHFWATWCGVCRREFGALHAVNASLDDDEVLWTVVEDGDDAAHVAAFAEERGLTYTILLADPETIATWRIGVFPTNYYISDEGRVAIRQTGMATRWGMRARLWWAGL